MLALLSINTSKYREEWRQNLWETIWVPESNSHIIETNTQTSKTPKNSSNIPKFLAPE
jgi:hypothetical protein